MNDAKTLHRALSPEILTEVLQSAGYRVHQVAPGGGPQVSPEGAPFVTSPVLVSATGGLPFEIHLFNPLTPGRKGAASGRPTIGGERGGESELTPPGAAWADAGFRAAFRVEGELPLALVNAWNVTHRFARLSLAGGMGASGGTGASNAWLLLDMDVIALGGVLADNLRAHLDVWDRLIPELVAWLRNELPKLAKAAPIAEPVAPAAPVGAEPVAPRAAPGADLPHDAPPPAAEAVA